MRLLLLALSLSGCAARVPAPPAAADPRAALEASLARLVEPVLAERETRAVGVVVVEADQAHVFGFGRRNGSDPRPPDAETTFEIGSISKAIAGILLADAARRGEVAPSDPARTHLPADLALRFEPTLEHLGTLTSGFPLMPDNWITLDPVTQRTRYTLDHLRAYLGAFMPAAAPGERYSYSNVDTALLAMALSARAGTSYAELLHARVFAPLGMTRSVYAGGPPGDGNRLAGHDAEERLRPVRFDVSPIGPCCAIRTTLADMSRFMRGVMPATPSALSEAFGVAVRPRVPLDADRDRFAGLGWVAQPRYGRVTKNGQVEGQRSVLTLFPEARRGVFVVVNSEATDVDGLADRLVDALFAPRPRGLAERGEHLVEALPANSAPTDVAFDGAIRLEGWTAPACVRPGETARLTYYYRSLRPLDRDWKVFVHGDAETAGVARLHGDHYPAGGRGTTLDWRPGDLVADAFELVVPVSYAAGSFTVWTGWYRGGERLPATSEAREVVKDRVRGPTIAVGGCR